MANKKNRTVLTQEEEARIKELQKQYDEKREKLTLVDMINSRLQEMSLEELRYAQRLIGKHREVTKYFQLINILSRTF